MTRIDYLKAIVAFLPILLVYVAPLHAAQLSLTAAEQAYLQQHPVIRVGVDHNWPPFDYYLEQKGHQGIASGFLHEVAKRLGVKLEYHPASWQQVLNAVRAGETDMLACAARTPQREEYLCFTAPYILIDTAVFVHKGNDSIRSMADLAGKVVALPQGNFLNDYLVNHYPHIKLRLTASNEDAIDLLAMEKVDAYIGNMAAANYFIEHNVITTVSVAFKVPELKTGLCFASRREDPMLAQILDKALASIDSTVHRRILRQWVNYFSRSHSVDATLTAEERQWIRKHPIMRVGCGRDWTPFDFSSGDRYQGIAREYLDLLESRTGLSFVFSSSKSRAGLFELLRHHKVDLVAAASPDDSGRFLFSRPYAAVHEFVIVKEQNRSITRLDDIASCRAVAVNGSSGLLSLKRRFPTLRTRVAPSIAAALRILADNKADFYVGTFAAASYVANRDGLPDIRALFPVASEPAKLCMATRRENLVLCSIINKGLKHISAQERESISKRWLQQDGKKITFSHEQQRWIAAQRGIRISGNPAAGPLSFYDEQGCYRGIIADYIKLIAKRTGLKFIPRRSATFADALQALAERRTDLVDAAAYTHSRALKFSFSRAYLKLEYAIAVRKGGFSPRAINDLAGHHVGVVDGYRVGDDLANDVDDVQVHRFPSYADGLEALSQGQLDAFIIDLPTLDYISAKFGISNVKVSGLAPYSYPLRFMMPRNAVMLRTVINKALASIDTNERREIYRRWVTFEYEAQIDYTLMWQIAGMLFLVITGTLFWTWRLSLEIERRKRVEDELRRAKDLAEQATRAKSEFLANMSHEIRTPMNSVIGFTEILDELITDPVQKDYLHSVKIGGRALLRIINDILDLSKIEAGQLQLQYESINPGQLFGEIEQLFYEKIRQKGLQLHIEIDPEIPEYVLFDGVRLRQILFNLVGNAIKFTDTGSVTLRVAKVYKDRQRSKLDLQIDVIDTGMGIAPADRQRIFGVFEQQTGQSQRRYGGTGLGLSICKKLVTMMGGDICVSSVVGEGSTFTVRLYDIDVSSTRAADSVENALCRIEFEPATVMVVDDVADNRRLLRAVLSATPLALVEAKHGLDALEQLEVVAVDLIMMDLRMPVLDGYETVRRIRACDRLRHLPVIALTASVLGEDLECIGDLGFDGYLRKPAEKQEILEILASFLPCDVVDGETSSAVDNGQIVDENVRKIVYGRLAGELQKRWRQIKDKGDMEQIRCFNAELENVAAEYNLQSINAYCRQLGVAIGAFDLAAVSALLNQYPSLMTGLKPGEG